MKKFEFSEITDEVIINTKIDQLKVLSDQVRQTVENPDSSFTSIPATITPAGLELDPDTPENLENN